MNEFLKQIPPEWLFFGAFMLGQWWSDRRHFAGRREQGQRIGGHDDRIARLEGLLRVTPDPRGEGHGQ